MDDLISRQMLLEYIHGEPVGRLLCDKYNLDGLIKQLPPIQTVNNSENPNSSDVISRQKAIDALRKMQTYKLFSGDDMLLIDQAGAMAELMLLPPADVVPVVRCKDCKFHDEDAFCTGRGFPCQLVPDDGFCDKGEKE